MNKHAYFFFFTIGSALTGFSSAATISFDLNNNTDFDGSAGVGTTMSASDAAGTATVIATTIDILAPEFVDTDGVFAASGVTLSAANGDAVVTSIGSSNSLGINNQSIGNVAYRNDIQGNTSGTEGNDFNPGEAWVVSFDTTITITEFDFSSIDNADEFFDVTIAGTTFSFGDAGAADDYLDPLNGLVIAAGTNITFAARGPFETTHIRISEITVETVPEPSTAALLGLMGVFAGLRRRR